MSPVDAAKELIVGMENEDFEIKIGQTADFRKFYLTSPAEAFAMMNQPMRL
jgi:uncharacterized oxidoreductase